MVGKVLDSTELRPEVETEYDELDAVCKERNFNVTAETEIMAMVARLVGFKEMPSNQEARDSVDEEYGKLKRRTVWDYDNPKEYRDVVDDAIAFDYEVHMGILFATCTEKNAELPKGHAKRKYKGRVCYDGRPHRVKNKWGAHIVYQHLDSQPASMPAGKSGIAYGMFPGYFVEIADAVSAYTQAEFVGTLTYVEIEKSQWEPGWAAKFARPVCQLLMNIYGHPQAGPLYERWAHKRILGVQFTAVMGWRSVYYCDTLMLCLILYVDDIILSGPRKNKEIGWYLIGQALEIDEPHSIDRYLGCHHQQFLCDYDHPAEGAKGMEMEMIEYFTSAVEKYKDLTGNKVLKRVDSPYVDMRAIADADWEVTGEVKEDAAKVLMSFFYGARACRWDLIYATSWLTRYLAKWSKAHDKMLYRLACYVSCTLDYAMFGWVGDLPADVFIQHCIDADHGGDALDVKATSGGHMFERRNDTIPTT
jgi:hypothetical protein